MNGIHDTREKHLISFLPDIHPLARPVREAVPST
jgi:hypothetical protein